MVRTNIVHNLVLVLHTALGYTKLEPTEEDKAIVKKIEEGRLQIPFV